MKGLDLYHKARTRIPGATQLLSKRPEMHAPEQWPPYYARAKGAEVWDLDGRKFVDMSYAGIGSCILGYADADIDDAVRAAIDAGSMCTLNAPEEVELADLLCELHPWADKVRYARCGGEAMAVAVRIARARTGREKVAFCGYHGWHDWYLAANLPQGDALDGHLLSGLAPAGVPASLSGTALPFHYNRLDELERIVAANRGELAAIVMEPVRNNEPVAGFLESVRALANDTGAVLVFDEVTAAFRATNGGIHLRYGVSPDIAVFAKAISNGYPMAAIIGRGDVMSAAEGSFISSTYWTERIGPTAALATIRKHRERDVVRHLEKMGRLVQEGWRSAAERAGLPVTVSGMPALSHFSINLANAQAVRTLFTQMMLDRGFLATNAFYAMYAHSTAQVEQYVAAVQEVFRELATAVECNGVDRLLRGPVAHAGFYRLT
ncbi:MAG: aminotransferase class III-fold pyridoxal phosphate-dependent enzyme [Acidobacteriales bacterium]|nr:aminotransferase class III-fold pyridoxal phosphate-dependent enzyme [Terriglobales bacterium]